MSTSDIFSAPYGEIISAFVSDLLKRHEASACMERLTGYYSHALPVLMDQLKQNTSRVAELNRRLHFLRVAVAEDRAQIEADRRELDQLMSEGDELIELVDPATQDWLSSLTDFERASEALWTWAALESYVANTFRLAMYAKLTAEHREKHPDAPMTQTHRSRIDSKVKRAYETTRKQGLPGIMEGFDAELGIHVNLSRDDEEALAQARRLRNRVVHDSLQFKIERDGTIGVGGERAREGDLVTAEDLALTDRVAYRVMLAVDGAVTTALVGPGGIDRSHEEFRAYFKKLLEDGLDPE